MGTRNLTAVMLNGEYRIAQYGQFDGYPSGQGVTALNFIRNCNLMKFADRLEECSFLTEEERLQPSKGVPPEFDRDTAAGILKLVYESTGPIKLHSSIDFVNDSLFCEWAYVIDLDLNTFEVYKGFNKTQFPGPSARFKGGMRDGYYSVVMVTSFPLDNLPTKDEFLHMLESIQAEDE